VGHQQPRAGRAGRGPGAHFGGDILRPAGGRELRDRPARGGPGHPAHRIFLPNLYLQAHRADIARPDLPDAIRAGGGIADDVCAYRTLPAETDREGLAQIVEGLDTLTFTSPSTVENFCQIMVSEGLDPLDLPGNPEVMCIGPITARAAQNKGFQVTAIPEDYTIEGLLHAIKDHFQENVHE